MRKIFLCHASEDKQEAEQIQLALVSAGYNVFYDEESLPPGGDFHSRIQRAILRCDLFIFLATSNSVTPGKFTLTELKFARERWASPVGRVLTVNLGKLPTSNLPSYLTAATVMSVAGNPASEVRAAAENVLGSPGRRIVFVVLSVSVVALAGAIGTWRFLDRLPAPVMRGAACGTVLPAPHNDFLGLAWAEVPGASTYTVEVDLFDCTQRTWLSQTGKPWHVRQGLGIRSPIYNSSLFREYREQNGCALRWRVWAIDQNGSLGNKSDWCQYGFAGAR